MHKNLLTLAVLLSLTSLSHAQTSAQLNPQAKRITDQAIHADYQTYEAVQGRIKALNDQGRRVADYHLAKAQCWLDVSFHEYTRNDRSAFPQEALTESEKLVYGMEQKQVLGDETPLVNNADKLRPDLWEAADKLHQHSGFRCAAQQTACAEVELVHAGNEHKQQGWRHGKPYIQIAEDLVGQAQRAAEQCASAAPVTPVVAVAMKPVQLDANVLFNFDKHDMVNVRSLTKIRLDKLISQLKSGEVTANEILIVGHADRLNSTGKRDYNIELAKRRVATIKSYMIGQGIDAKLIKTDAHADSEQVVACTARYRSAVELQECLLPNRRVEVQINGQK
ncbi:OmpA family protein [Ampullimonas aquatilis]|uniref:OmpA family protein n=1 Tax=Ampullimonas aquatilis TaxID=1341549 RepID=UPI003C740E5A